MPVAAILVLSFFGCGDSLAAGCASNDPSNRQRMSQAVSRFQRDQRDSAALLEIARCEYFLGAYPEAVRDASEVLRREPRHAEAFLVRAKAGKMTGNIPRAMDDYSASIALRPSAEAYYGRGLTLRHEFRGRERQAMADFSAAIKLDPGHVGARAARAQLYSLAERYAEALEDLQIVLRLAPATPHVLCNIGFAHYALGRDPQGRAFLNDCYRRDPDPRTRGYYETEVRKVLYARQAPARRNGGNSANGGEGATWLGREREREQNVIDSRRISGDSAGAEACRTDSSKC